MSSLYVWADLPTVVIQSIDVQPDANDDPIRGKSCGCHGRGDRWWLCQYHVGMVDGYEAAQEP